MNIDPNRVRALFALRRVQVSQIANLLGCSSTYVSQQISGEKRLTSELLGVLQGVIGPDAWAWVIGRTNVLVIAEDEPSAAPLGFAEEEK